MKVALQIDQLWFDAPGGIGTYVHQLLHGLDERTDVEVVPFHARWRRRSPAAGGPLTADGRFPGVELRGSIRALYPSWAFLRRPRLPAALGDAAVVHATNHAAIPPVRPGQALVVTVHDLVADRFPELVPARWRALYRRGVRLAMAEAARILVPSESVRVELLAAGAEPDRVRTVPLASAFDAGATGQLAREDLAGRGVEPPFVLSVGTLEPRKNHLRLLRAYRRLAAEGLPHALVLVGERGWDVDELMEELRRPGPGRVVHARLSGPSLGQAYRLADAVAYVSLYEGFGLPVLEAMSAGAAVVTSNVSSMPEVAGDAALLVDPTDEDAIAEALRRVLTDPALADELRGRGRERAAAFSWDRTVAATVEVYRSVAGAS